MRPSDRCCWVATVSDWLRKWPGESRRGVGRGRVVMLEFMLCCIMADESLAGLGEDLPERRFIHGFGDNRPVAIQGFGDERPSGGELGVVAAVERLIEDEGVKGEYLGYGDCSIILADFGGTCGGVGDLSVLGEE